MKKTLFPLLVLVLTATQTVSAHDPRTVAKELSHSLMVEGAGKLTLTFKSLHYNDGVYTRLKTNPQAITNLNRLWRTIGKFESEFDVVIGGVEVPKGTYGLGVGFDAQDNYKLLLSGGGTEITIPLKTALDGPVVNYLSFDVRPENDTDMFILEGRYGKVRASADLKVPYLAPHEHEKK